MSDRRELMNGTSYSLSDDSLRVHTKDIVEYIIRGNGRRIVPKAIYLAAWELQYALNRVSTTKDEVPK
jgi:hypothetical protein